jgi:hypothetical protein
MSAAQMTDALAVPAAQGIPNHKASDKAIFADLMAHDKRFANIAAHLAFLGYSLHPLSHGGYLIARHDRSAYAPDLRGARAFLERARGGA